MAKYNILDLNYIAVGEDRNFINFDIELDYQIYDVIHFLCAENQSSGYVSMYDKGDETKIVKLSHDIGTEQGDGYYYKSEYIQKESSEPLSKERDLSSIILNEQQEYFIETDPSKRKYIRLYLSCCTIEMKQKIDEFNKNRTKINSTYLIDNTQNDKNNVTCLNNVIHNLYDIQDMSIKKYGVHELKNNYLHDLDYHHDIYVPQMTEMPIGFCQSQTNDYYMNDTVMMTKGYKVSPYTLKSNIDTIEDVGDLEYEMQLSTDYLKTYTYKNRDFSTPYRNYKNISYSYIIDIPNDATQAENSKSTNIANYDIGDLYYLRLHTGKNAYNSTYTMQMSSYDEIQNCRTYCGINTSGGQPYLVYYDDLTYVKESEKLDSSTGILNIQTYETNSSNGSKNDTTTKPFQKIEFIYPNDQTNNAKHKANIFTVDILDTNIENVEDSIDDDNENKNLLKQKLQQLKFDIHSAVKEIADNVCPANTQLFNVYFGGNE